MTEEDWRVSFARALAIFLSGDGLRARDTRGRSIVDDSFYLILNGHHETLDFTIPKSLDEIEWKVVVDTNHPTTKGTRYHAGDQIEMGGRSVMLLMRARKRRAPSTAAAPR